VYPPILIWAAFPLPDGLRWIGAALSLVVLPLILWVQESLGSNFSTTIHIREEHTLVTKGPYRWIRHPMYTVLMMQSIGLLLLTANWFIGGSYSLLLMIIMIARTPFEENMMIEKFGEQYRAYMRQTGKFLPKLTR
jgi:protein-S-isoprenylcysteine O-methyltransferase Ste14